MPELPEVENVVKELVESLPIGSRLLDFSRSDKALRFENFANLPAAELHGAELLKVYRRAKYIIFETNRGVIVSHLGMTGVWSVEKVLGSDDPAIARVKNERPKNWDIHSHASILWEFKNQFIRLNYSDPRRFGAFLPMSTQTFEKLKLLVNLGPEPFDENFNVEYLFAKARNKRVPVKSFVMNQDVVVGVGNIYASESLFYAQILPQKFAGEITPTEWAIWLVEVRNVLTRAIEAGGSTLKDYRQVNGQSGKFQNSFAVYGREFEPCYGCGEPIKSIRQSGRATFYCESCQR